MRQGRRHGRGGRVAAGLLLTAWAFRPLVDAAWAQDARPSEETLRTLQERGRAVFLYLQAVESSARLLQRHASEGVRSDRTVVIFDRDGWRVDFLRDLTKESGPTESKKGMILVAQTSFSPDSGEVGELTIMEPPHAAPATAQSYARALEQAEEAVASRPDAGAPFEDAVIREKDATFTVYLLSHHDEEGAGDAKGGTAPGSVRFGHDFVIRIAASGRQLLSVEPLHASAATVPLAARPAGQPTLHAHEQGSLPLPTDVALVMRHRALAPHLVLTPQFMFRIDAEGAITWLGPNTIPQVPRTGGTP